MEKDGEGGGFHAHGFEDGDEAVIVVDQEPTAGGISRIMIVCTFFICYSHQLLLDILRASAIRQFN